MADPRIPQSAAPLGQAPMAAIRPVQDVPVIPGVMDVSTLDVAMGNISQALNDRLAQKQLDLLKQKQEHDIMQDMLDRTNNVFDEVYDLSKRGNGEVDGLGLLSSNYAGTQRVNSEIKNATDKYNERVSRITKQFVQNNGTADPQQLVVMQQGFLDAKADYYADLYGNADYVRFARSEAAFRNLMDKINEAKSEGYSVNPDTWPKFIKKYEAYMNEQAGVVMNDKDFDLDRYVFDAEKGITDLQIIAEKAVADKEIEVPWTDPETGVEYTKLEKVPRTPEEAGELLAQTGMMDPNIRGIARLAIASGQAENEQEYFRKVAAAYSGQTSSTLSGPNYDPRGFLERMALVKENAKAKPPKPEEVAADFRTEKYSEYLNNPRDVAGALETFLTTKMGTSASGNKEKMVKIGGMFAKVGGNPFTMDTHAEALNSFSDSNYFTIDGNKIAYRNRSGKEITSTSRLWEDYETNERIDKPGNLDNGVYYEPPSSFLTDDDWDQEYGHEERARLHTVRETLSDLKDMIDAGTLDLETDEVKRIVDMRNEFEDAYEKWQTDKNIIGQRIRGKHKETMDNVLSRYQRLQVYEFKEQEKDLLDQYR